jgi:hypothetical protein
LCLIPGRKEEEVPMPPDQMAGAEGEVQYQEQGEVQYTE